MLPHITFTIIILLFCNGAAWSDSATFENHTLAPLHISNDENNDNKIISMTDVKRAVDDLKVKWKTFARKKRLSILKKNKNFLPILEELTLRCTQRDTLVSDAEIHIFDQEVIQLNATMEALKLFLDIYTALQDENLSLYEFTDIHHETLADIRADIESLELILAYEPDLIHNVRTTLRMIYDSITRLCAEAPKARASKIEIPDFFHSGSWLGIKDILPSEISRVLKELDTDRKKFYVIKNESCYLIILEKGFNAIGFFVKQDDHWVRIIEKGADLLFPFVNRILLDDGGYFTWEDENKEPYYIPMLTEELRENNRWMNEWVTPNPLKVSPGLAVRHGVVRKQPFRFLEWNRIDHKVYITAEINLKDQMEAQSIHFINPEFYAFYKTLSLKVTYELEINQWNLKAAVTNDISATHSVPFAFTPHYWINTRLYPDNQREDTHIEFMFNKDYQRWDANEDHLPTGRLNPVGPFDRSLILDKPYDDVFFTGKGPSIFRIFLDNDSGFITVRQEDGYQNVVIHAASPGDPDIGHLVALEPSTSATNAFDMVYVEPEYTNLLTLRPGETRILESSVFYTPKISVTIRPVDTAA